MPQTPNSQLPTSRGSAAPTALAVIPARGGSKRIPGKNTRSFCGKPILEYSVSAALESGLFDQVIVSTDSDKIAEVARRVGAEVPFVRPAEIANDTATTADVLVHALDWYEEQGRRWDWLCCLYPTAPFVDAARLREAAGLLRETKAPGVLTVCRFGYPIQRAVRLREDETLEWRQPEHECTRSQDLEEAYHDAGQCYMWPAASFRANPRLMPEGARPLILDRKRVVDIDTEEDWEFAEHLYRAMNA